MIFRYLRKKEVLLVLLSIGLVALTVHFELKIPDYMTDITFLINTGCEIGEVMDAGVKMILCAFVSFVATIVCTVIGAHVATSFSKRLRELQFDKVQSFSIEEMDRFSIASLVTRSTNDITQIQMTVAMGLLIFIRAPIMACWAIVKILGKNFDWTVATAGAIIAMLTVVACVIIYAVPKFKKIQGYTDNVNRITRENITGIRVIRAYNAEKFQDDRFEEANDNLTSNTLSAQRAVSTLLPSLTLVLNGLNLSIYWIGAALIYKTGSTIDQSMLFADMVAFSSYAMQVIMSFIMMVMILMILPRASVASKRIQEVICTEPSIVSGNSSPNKDASGCISFKNVSFRYPGNSSDSISNISFDVKKGETLAIIGPTGSGKSTLVNLIPRLFDVREGSVEVCGLDVREYNMKELRAMIGYVPQTAFLFSGTVDSNVRYGHGSDEKTEEDVRRAISIAQASEFIESKEEGLQSSVSQGGSNFSGGQKQRLSIARAICKDPDIYIFDDTFSALDFKTDSVLRAKLKMETEGATTIIVAQRVSTIMHANNILVLNDGRIVGSGTHNELLVGCPEYLEIVRSQMSEKEAGI